jgi:hypothetical protein
MNSMGGLFLTGHRGISTLRGYMRRKSVHIIAAIAELFRFFAIAFLAFSVGALFDSSVSSLLRYAAAPQFLFAVGFFFMWLDPVRYSSYRSLLAVGKCASAICFLPLASALVGNPWAMASSFGIRGFGVSLAFFIAIVDIASLLVLFLVRGESLVGSGGMPAPIDPPQPGPSMPGQGPSGPSFPGQGPGDIEQVEA